MANLFLKVKLSNLRFCVFFFVSNRIINYKGNGQSNSSTRSQSTARQHQALIEKDYENENSICNTDSVSGLIIKEKELKKILKRLKKSYQTIFQYN